MKVAAQLEEFLTLSKAIVILLLKRKNFIEELHPCFGGHTDDKDTMIKDIAIANKRLRELLKEIRGIKFPENHPIGVVAILGDGEISDEIYLSCICLITARLSGRLDREFLKVDNFVDVISGDDPVKAVVVRNAFKESGILHPHISYRIRQPVADQYQITLKESCLEKCLGQKVSTEAIILDSIGYSKTMKRGLF